MTWRYMAGKRVHKYPGAFGTEDVETVYDVREYYDKYGVTVDSIAPNGETRAELIADLHRMLADLEDGMVWDDETETVVQE